MDYIEGGGGTDLIFGGLGQDDLIGGSSSLFGYTTPAQRAADGTDRVYGDTGTAVDLNNPGDTSANGHAHNADTILGDNGVIYRIVSAAGQYLTFNYDNYAARPSTSSRAPCCCSTTARPATPSTSPATRPRRTTARRS